MPGMMRSRVSGCLCCSATCADRASEKRDWVREVTDELYPDFEGEYWYFRERADMGLPILGGACLRLDGF